MSQPSRFDAAVDTFFGPDTGHEEPPVPASEKSGFGALAIGVAASVLIVIAGLLMLVKRLVS